MASRCNHIELSLERPLVPPPCQMPPRLRSGWLGRLGRPTDGTPEFQEGIPSHKQVAFVAIRWRTDQGCHRELWDVRRTERRNRHHRLTGPLWLAKGFASRTEAEPCGKFGRRWVRASSPGADVSAGCPMCGSARWKSSTRALPVNRVFGGHRLARTRRRFGCELIVVVLTSIPETPAIESKGASLLRFSEGLRRTKPARHGTTPSVTN